MAKPTHVKGRKPVKVGLHSLVEIIGEMHKLEHADKLHAHLSSNDAVVLIPPKTMNLFKDYLADHRLDDVSSIAKAVVNAEPNEDPNGCKYVHR